MIELDDDSALNLEMKNQEGSFHMGSLVETKPEENTLVKGMGNFLRSST